MQRTLHCPTKLVCVCVDMRRIRQKICYDLPFASSPCVFTIIESYINHVALLSHFFRSSTGFSFKQLFLCMPPNVVMNTLRIFCDFTVVLKFRNNLLQYYLI